MKTFCMKKILFTKVIPSWKLYFDRVAQSYGTKVEVDFVTSHDLVILYSFALTKKCSNNVIEYQAFILGLETTIDMDVHQLEVFGDSKLIVIQFLVSYEVHNLDLKPYHE